MLDGGVGWGCGVFLCSGGRGSTVAVAGNLASRERMTTTLSGYDACPRACMIAGAVF